MSRVTISKLHDLMHLADNSRDTGSVEHLQGSNFKMTHRVFKIAYRLTSKRTWSDLEKVFQNKTLRCIRATQASEFERDFSQVIILAAVRDSVLFVKAETGTSIFMLEACFKLS